MNGKTLAGRAAFKTLLAVVLVVGLLPGLSALAPQEAWAVVGANVTIYGANVTAVATRDGATLKTADLSTSASGSLGSAGVGKTLTVTASSKEGTVAGIPTYWFSRQGDVTVTQMGEDPVTWEITVPEDAATSSSINLEFYCYYPATVECQQFAGGTVSTDEPATGFAGGTVGVTLAPDEGYAPATVAYSADGGDTWNSIASLLTDNGDGTWSSSFTVRSSDAAPQHFLVKATFEPAEDTVIATEADLLAFAARVNAGDTFAGRNVVLANDLTLTGAWTPIDGQFSGTLDGAAHTISGLDIHDFVSNGYGSGYAGLFLYLHGATVKDLTLEGSITSDDSAICAVCGSICRLAEASTFKNCVNRVNVSAAWGNQVGGIVGDADDCTFVGCLNYGTIWCDTAGSHSIGGVAGDASSTYSGLRAFFTNCGNYAAISSAGYALGGITGSARGVQFLACANKGDVTGTVRAAGICGDLSQNTDCGLCSFIDCYNTGAVTVSSTASKRDGEPVAAGILALEATYSTATALFTNCYNTGTITRTGTLAETYPSTCTGQIAPDVLISGTSYAGFSEVDMSGAWQIAACYGQDDSFAAADLGVSWRDDVPSGSPLLSWEPADATNSKGGVPATGVTLSQDALSLEEGDAAVLEVTVEPENATSRVVWTSSDDAVATVSGKGAVTAVGAGTCTVTGTAGEVSASCAVTVSAFSGTLFAASTGDITITQGGAYKLSYGYSGRVTVATTQPVDVKGTGTGRSNALTDVFFDCTGQVTNLTLRDLYVSDSANVNLLNFAGDGNRLSIEGTCILDYLENRYAGGHDAVIHVGKGASLTIAGAGTLYLYKSGAGAGVGGDYEELNGDVTFAMSDATGNLFAKGTKQSALIGAGANAASDDEAPGAISFTGGTYNLISNSRGAAIGGSAGSAGASAGTQVLISGNACVNVNCDWTGTAVGGGGYAEGSDAGGGTLTVTGGSFRTYVDKNAASNVGGTYWKGLPLTEGISNVEVTAQRKNAAGDDVYLCAIDTTDIQPDADGNWTVTVDGETYYTGKTHAWAFLQEATDRALPGGGRAETGVTYTPDNWVAGDDPCLYVYLTGEDHEVEVNGVRLAATWDDAALGTSAECDGGCFALAEAEPIYEHTLGDVNANGKVNIVDAQIVYDMGCGKWNAAETDIAAGATAGTYGLLLDVLAAKGVIWNVATLAAAADANADGTVDATDAWAIQVLVFSE